METSPRLRSSSDKKTNLSTMHASPNKFSSMTIEQRLQIPKYRELYQYLYRQGKKSYWLIREQQQMKEVHEVKETISNQLKAEEGKRQFMNKFSLTQMKKRKKIHTALVKEEDEEKDKFQTTLQKNEEKVNQFLFDHQKTSPLIKDGRLMEYFLKDQEENKVKLLEGRRPDIPHSHYKKAKSYRKKHTTLPLDRNDIPFKHRRLTPTSHQTEKTFLKYHEVQFKLEKKKLYIKENSVKNKALTLVRNHPTNQRTSNFAQVAYLIKQDNHNLLRYHEISTYSEEQERKYSTLRKIYLHFAHFSQSHRIYFDYISEESRKKLQAVIIRLKTNPKLSEKLLGELVDEVLKYKYRKLIQFEDLREIFQTLKQNYQEDMIEKLKQQMAQIFKNEEEEFFHQNSKAIEKVLKKYRVDSALKLCFNVFENDLIGQKYMPMYILIEIIKQAQIVPHAITMCKFMRVCLLHERRREGFTMEEFKSMHIMLALSLQMSVKGVMKYFEMVQIDQIIKL